MEAIPATLNQCFHLYDRVHSLPNNMIETELKKLERFDTEHTIAITDGILNVSHLFSIVSTSEKGMQSNTAIIRAIHPAYNCLCCTCSIFTNFLCLSVSFGASIGIH